MEKKRLYEKELENIPKEQIKTIPEENLKDVYENLKDHMKSFGIDIEDLNPLNADEEEEPEPETEVKEKVAIVSDLTYEIFIHILDQYEAILRGNIEKFVATAKELLAKQDKEGFYSLNLNFSRSISIHSKKENI
jgi:hypothetical protein